MKHKFYSLGLAIICSILAVGILKPANTSATVPGVNEAVDVSATGGDPNGYAQPYGISQDGRYIVFVSLATNLVSPASNGQQQIFVRDRLNNKTTLVSVSSSGTEGNAGSYYPRISADGRYVVFDSDATNLVSGDTNGVSDVFIHDMTNGTTQLVSANTSGIEGNNTSSHPDVSADGNYVVFDSYATNLVSSPSVSSDNVYEKNMITGNVQLLSQSPSGQSGNQRSLYPKISCEGRFVVFESFADNLVPNGPNTNLNLMRIYLVDTLKPIAPMYLVALPTTGMADPTISCNGSYIAFASGATNIVSNITNGQVNAYVYDRINNTFDMDSVATNGTQANGGVDDWPNVSNDGKYLVFDDTATNLVPEGGQTGFVNVFLHNRQTGTTELIDRSASDVIANNNGASWGSISSDGRYVTYASGANNLVSGFQSTISSAVFASQTGASDDY